MLKREQRKAFVIMTTLALVPLLFAGVEAVAGTAEMRCAIPQGLEAHDSISIEGDAMLALPNVGSVGNGVRSGQGTAEDPFVISGWEIRQGSFTIGGPEKAAIRIVSTTAHLRLENLLVRAVGSPLLGPVLIGDVENVSLRNVTIVGGAPQGALELLRVTGFQATDLRFAPDEDGQAPEIGLIVGGVKGDVQSVVHCGEGDLMRRTTGRFESSRLNVSDVRSEASGFATMAFPPVAGLVLQNISGSIHLTVDGRPGGAFTLEDLRLSALTIAGSFTKSEQVTIRNVEISGQGTCAYRGGLSVDVQQASVDIHNLTITGYGGWIATSRSSALNIQDSVFSTQGGGDCGFVRDPLLTLAADCSAGCGRFEMSRSDIIDDGDRPAILFPSDKAVLVGHSNYLGSLIVEGSVSFVDERHAPKGAAEPATAPAPSLGAFVLLLVLAFVLGALRSRRS